jgi:endonuclease/exonuclease/phosphatase family metal-dependent hydrolase
LIPDPNDVHLGNQPRDFVDPRAFSSAIIADGSSGWKIGVGVTHLDHKSEELREKQILKGIRESVNPCFLQDDNTLLPHVICGDWNTFRKSDCDEVGWNAILDMYKSRGWRPPPDESLVLKAVEAQGYKDTFYERIVSKEDGETTKYPAATAWTTNPLMRIDHIFSKNDNDNPNAARITVKDHFRVDTDASDHFPIVIDMKIETW